MTRDGYKEILAKLEAGAYEGEEKAFMQAKLKAYDKTMTKRETVTISAEDVGTLVL